MGSEARAVVCRPVPGRLVMLGDIHARPAALRRLLRRAGLLGPDDEWCGEPGSILVQAGDLIDISVRLLRLGGAGRGAKEGGEGPGEDALESGLARLAEPSITRLAQGGGSERRAADALSRVLGPPRSWSHARTRRSRLDLLAALRSLECLELLLRLQVRAREVGSEVLILRGNHEQDLLRGSFRWFAGQKEMLLLLMGADPLDLSSLGEQPPQERASLLEGLARCVPLLGRLSALPVIARVGRIAVVHGGPPARLIRRLEVERIRDLDGLRDLLQAGLDAGPDHPLWDEGKSLLSPDGLEDDPVAFPLLVLRFLEVLEADLLVLGHSPFLGFPRGVWQDTGRPEVRVHLRSMLRLGPAGRILKLDGDLKRQEGGGGVVYAHFVQGRLDALGPEGSRRSLLYPGEGLHGLGGGPGALRTELLEQEELETARPWQEQVGVDAAEVEQLWELLAALGMEEAGGSPRLMDHQELAELRRRLVLLLRAGACDLSLALQCLRGRLAGQRGGLVPLLRHIGVLEERIEELGHRTRAAAARARELHAFHLSTRDRRVDGLCYHLEELVLELLYQGREEPGPGGGGAHMPVLVALRALPGHGRGLRVEAVAMVGGPGTRARPVREELPCVPAVAEAGPGCGPGRGSDCQDELLAALERRICDRGQTELASLAPELHEALSGSMAEDRPTDRPCAKPPPSSPEPDAGGLQPSSASTPAPPLPRHLLDAARTLVAKNGPALAEGYLGPGPFELAELSREADRDGVSRGLLRLRLKGRERPLYAALLPHMGGAGLLLLVNDAFLGLSRPFALVRVEHRDGATWELLWDASRVLLGRLAACGEKRLAGAPLELWCGIRQEVLEILKAGDLAALGRGPSAGRAPWANAPFLFFTPYVQVARLFGAGSQLLRLEMPRDELEDLVRRGLARVDLMLLRRGDLPPGWGSIDLSPEVVACGMEGVEAFWTRTVVV